MYTVSVTKEKAMFKFFRFVALFAVFLGLGGCVAVPSVYYPTGYVIQTQCRPPYIPTFDGGCVLPPAYYYPGAGYSYFYYYRRR